MPTLSEIQTCITNLTANSEVTEMVVLAAETSNATTNRSIVVSDTDDLPDLTTNNITIGTVIFVQSLCVPVVSECYAWVSLDNKERVLRRDGFAGEIWSWGNGCVGRLGNNCTTNRSSPVSVVGGFTDWSQVSAGHAHSLALRNGTAWAWGCNGQGRLGDNTTTDRSSPVSVVGGYTDWCQISAGVNHSLAVRTNGTTWGWGTNTGGRLGDGTTTSRSSPVSVVGGFTDWCQSSAGSYHSIAVRQNGTLWAWGSNSYGRLGDNTTVDKSSPVSVVGGFTDWCYANAGRFSSSGVRTGGSAWAWGYNFRGNLGDGTTTSRSSPVSIVGGFTDWYKIAVSDLFSAGIRRNGTAWAWGYNGQGNLGDNTTASKSSPVSVVGGFTDWIDISAGKVSSHTLAIRYNGTAWGWGSGSYGRLGDNNATNRSSPVSVVGGYTDWCQISAGSNHSLGLRKY